MSGKTARYKLEKLFIGDDFFADGGQFSGTDRDLIDNLLYMGAQGHHHNGQAADVSDPSTGPTLSAVGGGTLPGGTRYFYKYTYVDANGFESAGSPEVSIQTPAPLDPPAAPTVTTAATGGTLEPGAYYYELSWYQGPNTIETTAINPTYISVPVGTSTNANTIAIPTAPPGADGWNLFRRGPGDAGYLLLHSAPVSVTSFVDNGTYEVDCNRGPASTNSTNSQNAIQVNIPGTLPAGVQWRVYRSKTTGVYSSSLVAQVPSGTTFLDTGTATTAGAPPGTSQIPPSPSQVNMTDGAEVQGVLPMGFVAAFPMAITFNYQGTLSAQDGMAVWPCPFPKAQVMFVQGALAPGSTPNAQPVIFDVNRMTPGGTPVSIFGETGLPEIPVGQQASTFTEPASVVTLQKGDLLVVDIDQSGGGTMTDKNLTVVIYVWVYGLPLTTFSPGTLNPPTEGASSLLTVISVADYGVGTDTATHTP